MSFLTFGRRFLGLVVLSFGMAGVAHAADRGTAPEAEAMVKRAVAFIKDKGPEKAYDEFTNGKQFKDRDLYVIVYDLEGKNLTQGASLERVEAGTRLVDEAGAAMKSIVAQVNRVATLIGEISTSALEQTNGIGRINQAITSLDQVTQQNAALVEEAAAAADSLNQLAGRMVEAVSVFKLG